MFNDMKNVYLDHAATTYVRDGVMKIMKPFFIEKYGNPSSFHSVGKEMRDVVETARDLIAKNLDCRTAEIIFTSGGTESDNLAILGVARANKNKGKHIITTKIEHPAVLEPCKQLEKEGFEVTYLSVNEDGIVDVKRIKEALREDTIIVSVMYANNEIGTIQPITEIAKIIRDNTKKEKTGFPVLHTDACQAVGALDINVLRLGVDMLTFNGSKIYGPKGIGVLYIKKGIKLEPLIFGGGQERGFRSGTENIAGIVGLAHALDLSQKEKDKENKRLTELRDYLIKELLEKIPNSRLNGDATNRLPNNANISTPRVEGEAMVLYLDSKGIYVATGSACSSKSLEASHVLLALGLPHELAHNSLRFTLGKKTTKNDIDYVIKIVPEIAKKLTEMSSL